MFDPCIICVATTGSALTKAAARSHGNNERLLSARLPSPFAEANGRSPPFVIGPNPPFASSQDAAQQFSEAAVRAPRSKSKVRTVAVRQAADTRKVERPCLNSV
jgi:hypothetical protein